MKTGERASVLWARNPSSAHRRAPTLFKTFTRKTDAMKWARDTLVSLYEGMRGDTTSTSKEKIEIWIPGIKEWSEIYRNLDCRDELKSLF